MNTESKASALAIRHPFRADALIALKGGGRLDTEVFARSRAMAPATAAYHFNVLAEVGAITIDGGTARITERGEVLAGLSRGRNK